MLNNVRNKFLRHNAFLTIDLGIYNSLRKYSQKTKIPMGDLVCFALEDYFLKNNVKVRKIKNKRHSDYKNKKTTKRKE